jgi:hypothetical protein
MRPALSLFIAACLAACNNMAAGTITPVPPVHRLSARYEGVVVLVDQDPTIETKDPNHVLRANEQMLPQHYRAAMEQALRLAGFRVVAHASEPHALALRLALAVTEKGLEIEQVYRCRVSRPTGELVAQVDWRWPKGVYVEPAEVLDFATHNLTTDIVTSEPLIAHLEQARGTD